MAQTVQAKEAKPDTIRFRHSMSSATVMVKVGRDSLPLRFKNHCIELDAKGDEKIINALQKHPRNGVLFKEVKPNEVADSVKSQGHALQVLTEMDKSAIWTYFTQAEIDGLGLDLRSTKSDLIAGFIQLNKAL